MPVIVREYEFNKPIYVFLALIILFGFYGSCETDNWTQPFHDACKSAHTDPEISLPLVVTHEYVLRGYEYIWGHPVISGDYILITGFKVLEYPDGFYSEAYSTNKLHCFSVESGEEIWTLDIGDGDKTPLISGDIVLVPADTLQCYSIETGEPIWESEITTRYMPTIYGDTAYVVVSEPYPWLYNVTDVVESELDPGLYGVDIHNGEFWRIDRNTESTYTFKGYITIADNILYLPYTKDTEQGILAMDCHTGDILWETTEHPYRQYYGRIILCDKESLYFIDGSYELLALSRETGELLWTFGEDLSLYGNLTADDSHIYAYSRSTSSVWCVDKKTGYPIWQSEPIFSDDEDTFLASSEDYIFISQEPFFFYPKKGYMYASCEFFIHALDNQTGATVWNSRAFGFPPGPFALCRDSLVVGSGSKAFVLQHLKEEPEEQSLPLEPSIPTVCAVVQICFILIFVLIWVYRHHLSQ